MKKLLILMFSVVLLTACGNSSESKEVSANSETVSIFQNDRIFTHDMEGVNLSIDYEVKKITGKVVKSGETTLQPGDFILEITGEIKNEFEQSIYYNPKFTVQMDNQIQLEEVSTTVNVEQLKVEPRMKETFTNVYVISKGNYGKFSSLTLLVPAAFIEPDSESSGDALGDSTNWEIPIK